MGPVYEVFWVSVGYISDKMPMEKEGKIIIKTLPISQQKEAGFDYLRDMTALDISERIQGRLDYVIVDETIPY